MSGVTVNDPDTGVDNGLQLQGDNPMYLSERQGNTLQGEPVYYHELIDKQSELFHTLPGIGVMVKG